MPDELAIQEPPNIQEQTIQKSNVEEHRKKNFFLINTEILNPLALIPMLAPVEINKQDPISMGAESPLEITVNQEQDEYEEQEQEHK